MAFALYRIMAEHEKSWQGPDGVPITVGTVKVEDPDELVVEGESFSNNKIEKSDFASSRKILTGNTQRKTVAAKSGLLAKNMAQRCFHMDKR